MKAMYLLVFLEITSQGSDKEFFTAALNILLIWYFIKNSKPCIMKQEENLNFDWKAKQGVNCSD